MKEKLSLWCDLNDIHDIEHMEQLADMLAQFSHVCAYHRYDYLFLWYHALVHGKIDEEAFFTLGDITGAEGMFAHARRAWLETVFMLEEAIADQTLYIVEQSARAYFLGKVGEKVWKALQKDIESHGSALVVI